VKISCQRESLLLRSKTVSLSHVSKISVVTIFVIALSLIIGCNEAIDTDKDNAKLKSGSANARAKKSALEKGQETSKQGDAKVGEVIDLTLYFVSEQGDNLIESVVTVEKTESVAKAAIEGLISGPTTANSYRSVPVGTRLISISIDQGVAKVDFSREFIDGNGGGSAEEMMSVYSIVNTLTEFSTIDAVIFLVEGKRIDTISGHIDISEPVERREDLIAS